MTDEDKKLLLIDLSARLPYGVKCCAFEEIPEWFKKQYGDTKDLVKFDFTLDVDTFSYVIKNYDGDFKPYLRPMSSMTMEEKKEFSKLLVKRYCEEDWEGHISTSYCIEIDNVYTDDEDGIKYPSAFSIDAIDWLNAHHFDYRGLIEKDLAIEAPEGMY
jgi:hypothetical protein